MKVAVHGYDNVVAGMVDAGGEGGSLAEVSLKENGAQAGVGCCESAEDFWCVVVAAVVYEDELIVIAVVVAGGGYLVDQFFDAGLFVVEGNDYGNGLGHESYFRLEVIYRSNIKEQIQWYQQLSPREMVAGFSLGIFINGLPVNSVVLLLD